MKRRPPDAPSSPGEGEGRHRREGDAERYRRVAEIFGAVHGLPAEERAARLDEACRGDEDLRAEVELYLSQADLDEPPLATLDGRGALAQGAAALLSPTRRRGAPLPDRVGPFRVLQVLGEGGMGVVYEAEQTDPVSRRVALKVVRLGMDTGEVVTRFEAERQALAFMDHPGIARVLDAGTTEEGRPWFSMELVKGLPITAYCDREELSTRERLQLFVELCGAVQHAHQKGVIHRDLKPSNVLVTEVDGRAVPKVIDFGIAKAVGAALTEKTLVTQLGQALGTPAYMAPEQSDVASLDVDTRADVYALGVMLFELLVGRLPFEMRADWQEVLRSLARGDKDTPTPSRRFSMLTGAEQSAIARRRRVDPRALRSELRGDLDWIVHKAMDPVRDRRYHTANSLAVDVGRYLKDEPVVARPPTLGYRARKFVKRNRLGVAVASLAGLFLVAFSVGMGLLWQRSESHLKRAVAAEAAARQETLTAQQALDFLVGLFDNSDPTVIPGETVTAQQVVDRGAERVTDVLRDEPLGRARLLAALGSVYLSLGAPEKAVELLRETLELREQGGEPRDLVWTLGRLGEAEAAAGRHDEARALLERSLALAERTLGPDDLDVATSLMRLEKVYKEDGRMDDAQRLIERAIAIQEEALGPDDPRLADGLNHLGHIHFLMGRYAEALPLLEQSLSIKTRHHGAEHPVVAFELTNVATAEMKLGRLDSAQEHLERAQAIVERTLPLEHPQRTVALESLAGVHFLRAEHAQARSLYQRALDLEMAARPDSPHAAEIMVNLSVQLDKLGESESARALLEKALSIQEKAYGPEHPALTWTLESLGGLLRRQGDPAGGLRLAKRALSIAEATLPPGHPQLMWRLANTGFAHETVGNDAEARDLFERALAMHFETRGEAHPLTMELEKHLAQFLRRTGDAKAARVRYEHLLSVQTSELDPDDPAIALSLDELGALQAEAGELDAALASKERALAIRRAALPADDPAVARSIAAVDEVKRLQGEREDRR